MKLILGYAAVSKKYSAAQEEQLKGKFIALSKKTEDIEKNHRDYIDHARAIRELLSATFWVFVVKKTPLSPLLISSSRDPSSRLTSTPFAL